MLTPGIVLAVLSDPSSSAATSLAKFARPKSRILTTVVADDRSLLPFDHQVVRLDVAVHHAEVMRVLQALGGLANVIAGVRHRQPAVCGDDFIQVGAVNELHHQEVQVAGLLGIEGGDDVAVPQPGGRLHLAAESPHGRVVANQFRLDDLQRDHPVHDLVLRLVDIAHTTPSDQLQNLVTRMLAQLGR